MKSLNPVSDKIKPVWYINTQKISNYKRVVSCLKTVGIPVRCIDSLPDAVSLLTAEEKPSCLILDPEWNGAIRNSGIPVLTLPSADSQAQPLQGKLQMQLERFFAVEFGVHLNDGVPTAGPSK